MNIQSTSSRGPLCEDLTRDRTFDLQTRLLPLHSNPGRVALLQISRVPGTLSSACYDPGPLLEDSRPLSQLQTHGHLSSNTAIQTSPIASRNLRRSYALVHRCSFGPLRLSFHSYQHDDRLDKAKAFTDARSVTRGLYISMLKAHLLHAQQVSHICYIIACCS